MWRDLEEEAIRIGLDIHYFWSLNVKQWEKHVKVFNEQEEQRIKEIDTMNYVLGKYIGFAINDPKHYPNKPFSQKETKSKNMSIQDMEKVAILNTKLLGGVVHDNR